MRGRASSSINQIRQKTGWGGFIMTANAELGYARKQTVTRVLCQSEQTNIKQRVAF